MRKLIVLAVLAAVAFAAWPVVAHHAAEGIVDEDVYAMIDALVADTPHADMVFDDMGGGTTMIGIETPLQALEDLVADGLLTTVALLDGEVTLTIAFTDDRMVNVTILQVEGPEAATKAAPEPTTTSLGSVKASYR